MNLCQLPETNRIIIKLSSLWILPYIYESYIYNNKDICFILFLILTYSFIPINSFINKYIPIIGSITVLILRYEYIYNNSKIVISNLSLSTLFLTLSEKCININNFELQLWCYLAYQYIFYNLIRLIISNNLDITNYYYLHNIYLCYDIDSNYISTKYLYIYYSFMIIMIQLYKYNFDYMIL